MNIRCPHCDSTENIQSRGIRTTLNGTFTRYFCKKCNGWHQREQITEQEYFNPSKFAARTLPDYDKYDRFVISGVQNDTQVNVKFLRTLENYCLRNNAKLILIPIKYKYYDSSEFNVDPDLLIGSNFALHEKLRVLAGLPLCPTIQAPLLSLGNMSKGDSIIVASTTLQMTTLPTLDKKPAIMHTTGAITVPNFTKTKQGQMAVFNHSYSALVIEPDEEDCHIRVLNADDNNGFYDICETPGYYSGDKFTPLYTGVDALVMGDVHVSNVSAEVMNATFSNNTSICNILKPKKIVVHDVLDFSSDSHHNRSLFDRYSNHVLDRDNVEAELIETADWMKNYIPKYAELILISSNHTDHMDKWLCDYEQHNKTLKNSKLYYFMMGSILEHIEKYNEKPEAFQLWLEKYYKDKDQLPIIEFAETDYSLHGITLGLHGHRGSNGTRGSANSFSRLPIKTITGHSHSPSIFLSSYVVGTSSILDMPYTKGSPSSWRYCHCLICPNGKRMMIFIQQNGKWRKETKGN